MLYGWFSRLESVKQASTEAEREGIYALRYELYVGDRGAEVPGADHARRQIRDPIDDESTTVHLYAGEPGHLRGTARLRVFAPGTLPEQLAARYATSLFPGLDDLVLAELTGFMIRPGIRGRMVLPAMVRAVYDTLAGAHHTDILLASCRPGLVADYRTFGLRPYPGPLINEYDGISVPLLSVLSDLDYARRCNAMTVDLIEQHFGPSGRAPLDLGPWSALLAVDDARLDASDHAAIDAASSRLSASDQSVRTVFDDLPADARRHLIDGSCVLEVPRGSEVTVQGNIDRDLYVVLQGVFTVHRDGMHLASLGRGEFFGEMNFFSPERGRQATVRAATDGQVLLIRHDFLLELNRREPDAAFAIFMALGLTLSQRMITLQS